jgi:hypothetical protein
MKFLQTRMIPVSAVCLCSFMALPGYAQDTEPGAVVRVTPIAENDGLSDPETYPTCEDRIATAVTEVLAILKGSNPVDSCKPVELELKECKEDLNLSDETNIRIFNELSELRENPPPDPEITVMAEELEQLLTEMDQLQQKYNAAREALADSENNYAIAVERLASVGLNAVAGYSYAYGDVYKSALDFRDLTKIRNEFPRLDAGDCENALNWMSGQTGAEEPLLYDRIWVWEGNVPMICTRNSDYSPLVLAAKRNDEAQLVIFR